MSQALQNLTFMVSLLDKVSGPAGAMMKTMDSVTTRIQSGYRKIGYGAAGLAGTGYALDNLLQPTKEMQAAIGSLKSLDVTDETLSKLTKTSLQFSTQFGESSSEFVNSAYQIQSAISGLTGNELPDFTRASAILAKGTKADMGTITDYVGTMYNIFQKQADAMGRSDWINMLAGQTAIAVNIFKAEGNEIAAAFQNLGALASSKGIALSEQLAVIGNLKGALPGPEAGTAYRSFLEKVFEAQDKLNLKFVDSQNHMLPMVDILTKIRGKYGDLSDETKAFEVSKAFGKSPEAMKLITALIKNIDGLNSSMGQIGDKDAFARATKMAQAMTMPWDRATQGAKSLQTIIGMQLLPEINLFFDKINGGIETLSRWSDLFPELTRFVSLAVLGIFGLIAGLSALSVVVGVVSIAWIGLTSPLFLVPALIGVVVYSIYDLIRSGQELMAEWQVFETVFSAWDSVQAAVTGAIEYIMSAFDALKSWLHNFNLWEFLLSGVDALIGKINMIPGVNIDLGGMPKPIAAPAATSGNAGGGLMQKFSSMNNNQSRSIGTVQINNYESKKSLAQLVDEIQMAGG